MQAVLRADIDRALARQAALTEHVVELAGVVVVEEDVVPRQREALAAGVDGPGHGRQRALCVDERRACNAARVVTEQAHRQGVAVAVEDHRVGGQALAAAQHDAADVARCGGDALRGGAVTQLDTARRGQVGQALRQTRHAAIDRPDAVHLDVRDQHQRRRRGPRRGAAIGGVASEELAQTRVVKVAAERLPQRRKRTEACERLDTTGPQIGRHLHQARPAGADVRAFQAAVDGLGLVAEGDETLGLGRRRKARDGIGAVLHVGMQIEPIGMAAPGVTRQHRQRRQRHQRFKRAADLGQDFVEDPAHREHRRPGVDARAVDFDGAHLSAGRVAGFDQRHVEAACGEQQRRDQAADASANDDDSVRFSHKSYRAMCLRSRPARSARTSTR